MQVVALLTTNGNCPNRYSVKMHLILTPKTKHLLPEASKEIGSCVNFTEGKAKALKAQRAQKAQTLKPSFQP